jgi:hypothetical protein
MYSQVDDLLEAVFFLLKALQVLDTTRDRPVFGFV